MSPERRRLPYALLLSLLIHMLLLSLTFHGQGNWLLSFRFPWQDRWIEAPTLRVVLIPAQVIDAEPAQTPVAEPLQQAPVEQRVARGPTLTASVSRAPTPGPTAAATVPEAHPTAADNPRVDAATVAVPAQMPLRADRPGETAPPPNPTPPVMAVPRTDEDTWVAPAPAMPTPEPATPAMPSPVIAAAPSSSSAESAPPPLRDAGDAARAETARLEADRQEAARVAAAQVEAARVDAARAEAARAEAARAEAARAEAARVTAAPVEAARAEAARAESARAEAARAESARAEAARVEAARAEAARAESARAEAARAESARAEAARAEAARAEAARAEAARVAAAPAAAARDDVAQDADARREAARRAMGRQLDEEAARREAATPAVRPSTPLPPSSGARRYWLFGRADPNAEVIMYAEAWSRKIQMNMTFDMVREAVKQPHADPVVTVAIRSDGSVESVTFVQSSGVAAIDEAIRRIVDSQKPYPAFPPGLAREYDVIHIRRTWYFDVAIRLY